MVPNGEHDKRDAAPQVGRPTDYGEEITSVICERIADGESLRAICSDDAMPSKSTVCKWLGLHDEFADQYACAREAQADALFDEMLDIADDGRNDWMEKRGRDGQSLGYIENGEALRRSALRIEARKWMAGKMRPKKYGDKIDVDHNVKGEIVTKIEIVPVEPIRREVAE